MHSPRGKLVFSSGSAGSGEARASSRAPADPSVPAAQQQIRVLRSSAGRGGKTVTLLHGFRSTKSEVLELLRTFKQRCAVGGTCRAEAGGFTLELQGDHVDLVVRLLNEQGFRAKRAGG